MRPLSALLGLVLFTPALQEPAPPAADVTDAAGVVVSVSGTTLVQEESEAGTLYVTRLPYVPLQTGRGEWRIPLAAIRRIDVAPAAVPAALARPGRWTARLRVKVQPEKAPAVTTIRSSGVVPLDAALGMAAAELPFTAPSGRGPAAERPVELEAVVQLQEVAPPPVRDLPVLTLQLRDGETATGRATGPLTLEGSRGSGTYRLRLRDCRRVEFRE